MLMESTASLDAVIKQGFEAFKQVMDRNLRLSEAEFIVNGEKLTLLDYLINKHQDDPETFKMLQYLLNNVSVSLRKNQPLHRAFRLGKLDIVKELLNYNSNIQSNREDKAIEEESGFKHFFTKVAKSAISNTVHAVESLLNLKIDINDRDEYGKTILHYAIACGDNDIFDMVMLLNPDFDATCVLQRPNQAPESLQPIHWAILHNNLHAFSRLIKNYNCVLPCMTEKYTPLLLIAQQVNPVLLENMLTYLNKVNFDVNQRDASGNTAIDLLTSQLQNNATRVDTIDCIARLISHGAKLSQEQTNTLLPYRQELVNASKSYLEKHPILAKGFMDRFHDQQDNLHHLFHTVNSWWQMILCLFGWREHTAFELEALITHCVSHNPKESLFNDDDQKFARFCELYNQEMDKSSFFKPLDPVLQMLESGTITKWSEIVDYAGQHINSKVDNIVRHITAVHQPKTEIVLHGGEQNKNKGEDIKEHMAILK